MLPAVLGIVSLGTEYGSWVLEKQTKQGAADAAAVSAAVTYSTGQIFSASPQAYAVSAAHGFVDGVDGVTVTVNIPPKSGNYAGVIGAVEVIVQQPQARLLSALWAKGPVSITARAVAAGNAGKGCVLVLNESASSAFKAQGTPKITLNGCSLYDNSANGTALRVGGAATVSALFVGAVGGILGESNITATQGIVSGSAPVPDPYAALADPSFGGCSDNNFTAKDLVTIDPGVYCGGMTINAGANVTLNPGTYYLDRGSLSVNGSATLQGDGVTLVFTSRTGKNYATATINGGATVNLTAPNTGPTAGIVFYGDRDAPAGTLFKFNGGASQNFGGALYLPKGDVTFAGGADTGTGCTQIVADTIAFVGNSNLAIDCSGYSTNPIGTAAAMLVE